MDQQLQNYVKQSRESGMTDEQIRRGLLNAGWGEEDIKGAFSQPEFRSTPEIPKNSGFKKELGPLGLIITSFVMSAAVIFVLPIVLQVIVLPFSLIFAILALIKAIKHRALKLIIISVIAI
ncbi:MAG: hypothetical protein HYS78_00470, partial [Parcubacteria group bacterium]|nr:hypothetical protein [Parcubacteria group bacterium]